MPDNSSALQDNHLRGRALTRPRQKSNLMFASLQGLPQILSRYIILTKVSNNDQRELRNYRRKAACSCYWLGYVGLPLIVEFCLKGFAVSGSSRHEEVGEITAGRSYIVDVSDENVKKR